MKYRAKPLIKEAFKWEGKTHQVGEPDWFALAVQMKKITFEYADTSIAKAILGEQKASKGDYIVRGVRNEIYAVKSEVFMDSYEEVEE